MIGSSAEPPSATRRTAARNSSTSLIRSFEQIADPFSGVGEQLQRQAELHVLGRTSTPTDGCRARVQGCLQAFVVVGRWQPDVDDCDVRCVAAHLEQEVVGGAALRNHLAARGLAVSSRVSPSRTAHCLRRSLHAWHLRAQARTRRRKGSRRAACLRAPRRGRRGPGADLTRVPAPSAPPRPSSATSTTTTLSCTVTSTLAELARACLPMFARLSETT